MATADAGPVPPLESPKRRKMDMMSAGAVGTTPQKVSMQKVVPTPADTGAKPDGERDADGGEDFALPVEVPAPAKKRSSAPALPRHRIAAKTPRGLAGRVAELVNARTMEAAGELPGAALAECILQVTGPPNATRAAAKARHLLRWLRVHAKRGSAKVCGRAIAPEDVQQAEQLVGDVWSKKLVKLQQRKAKAKEAKKAGLVRALTNSSFKSSSASSVKESKCVQGSDGAVAEEGDEASDDDVGCSDLSGEEDVDSEVEVGNAGEEDFVDFATMAKRSDDTYKGDWTGAPELGMPAFNKFAAAALRRAGVAQTMPVASLDASTPCPPLQPHQEAVVFMLHPRSPVSRMLVDHPTGSGKTREMIEVLDNYFFDPRPKVPVFPKEPVCRNFYAELLRWPSKYRDYFCCLRPHSAARACRTLSWRSRRTHVWDISNLGDKELRAICREVREVLEMKGCFYMGRMRRMWRDDFMARFPNEPLPAAPLRALRYTSAGGRHTMLREDDGLPVSALFKIGFNREDPNVYSNKIVIMDEVHNLVRTQTQFGEQLTHLRALLFQAQGTVLAGFTGTPILSEPQEGRQLLDIIKGASAPLGDAGFISSFPMRPPTLFPRALPEGVPDAVLTPKLRRQFVKKVALTSEALQRYDKKRSMGLPQRRLQRYCNLCVHFGAMHDGKNGSKARVLDDVNSCAPKLHAIANDIVADSSKALVLVARHSGMDALIAHLRRLASPSDGPARFGVATMDELAAFNSTANLRGELYRVLIADSTQCGEGVSFFAVRRVILADVPASPSSFVQAVGRSIRMYGHSGLPEDERTVTTTLYAATFPRWLRSPMGAWAYRAQRHHQEPQVAQSKARRLLRKLLKVGIPTLDALRDKVVAYFPKQAAAAAAAVAAAEQAAIAAAAELEAAEMPLAAQVDMEVEPAVGAGEDLTASQTGIAAEFMTPPRPGHAALPLSQGSVEATPQQEPSSSDASPKPRRSPSPPGRRPLRRLSSAADSVPSSRRRAACDDTTDAPSPAAAATAKARESPTADMKLPQSDVIKFLESIGLWEEAKHISVASTRHRENLMKKVVAAKLQGSPSKRALARRTSRELALPATAAAAAATVPRAPPKKAPQHWMVKALQWLLTEESVDKLVENMSLSSFTADEKALKSLAQHSRAFVPALRELRREAVDREVLENLTRSLRLSAGAGRFNDEEAAESDGESSCPEFGLSEASSAGEDDAPPPLVLPSGWEIKKFPRGKVFVREYVDPTGKRYKTEALARKAVDEQRRSANMADRLKQRFQARMSAARGVGSGTAGAVATDTGAEMPGSGQKRSLVAAA
mmetsp:Transcript_118857/g.341301  ORF Transcript_118857/g.341301 Transcript_118857/m.341301 type:complete len:1319 (+) Transcript_118857:145-4101(+)